MAEAQALMNRGELEAAGQLLAGIMVIADHRAEMRGVHFPVNGDDRNALVLQLLVTVVTGWQATGNEQRVTASSAKKL